MLTAISPGKHGLAGCLLDNLTRVLMQSFTSRLLFLVPSTRNTLDFTFTASTMTPEGKMASLPFAMALHQHQCQSMYGQVQNIVVTFALLHIG